MHPRIRIRIRPKRDICAQWISVFQVSVPISRCGYLHPSIAVSVDFNNGGYLHPHSADLLREKSFFYVHLWVSVWIGATSAIAVSEVSC